MWLVLNNSKKNFWGTFWEADRVTATLDHRFLERHSKFEKNETPGKLDIIPVFDVSATVRAVSAVELLVLDHTIL